MPIQKSGTETPNWLNTGAAWSTSEPLRTAESTPSGKATSSATHERRPRAMQRGGQPLQQIEVTVSPLRKLTPRSPVSA